MRYAIVASGIETPTVVPKRPVLRYHGGKWRIAPWIISHFPEHKIYVEPYGGAASVLMRKPRVPGEVYNDLNGEVVNLFKVLRDPVSASKLQSLLRLTPFARTEYEESMSMSDDPVEQARRTVVRSMMGFGTTGLLGGKTGFRSRVYTKAATGSNDWATIPDAINSMTKRLQGVVIENRPALDLISAHDSPGTLFYMDPPYVHSTRSAYKTNGAYMNEMSESDHICLANCLHSLKGMVVLSGYHSDLYDDLYRNWRVVEKQCYADQAKPRVEVLWLSPNIETPLRLFPKE